MNERASKTLRVFRALKWALDLGNKGLWASRLWCAYNNLLHPPPPMKILDLPLSRANVLYRKKFQYKPSQISD